tara:strand:- start:22261 stop:23916 length:1656 start_codon:yes stop_codon:yes gene_type:complete
MAEQLYILETFPIQVSPGGTWAQKDVPDFSLNTSAVGDGVADGGNIPLYGRIKSIDDQQYSVSVGDFNIGNYYASNSGLDGLNSIVPDGGNADDAIDTMVFRKEFVNGELGQAPNPANNATIVLPQGVQKIVLRDALEWGSFTNSIQSGCTPVGQMVGIMYNYVEVLVYLDPLFEIGNQNIDTIIDIDGNGNEICGQTPSLYGGGDIRVVVELAGKRNSIYLDENGLVQADGEPHCTIAAYPWGIAGGGFTNNFNMNMTGTGDSLEGDGTEASINFTPQTFGSSEYLQSASQPNIYQPWWFYIIPDEGYTISKDLLWVQHDLEDTNYMSPSSDMWSYCNNCPSGMLSDARRFSFNRYHDEISAVETEYIVGGDIPSTSAFNQFPPFGITTGDWYASTHHQAIKIQKDGVLMNYSDLNDMSSAVGLGWGQIVFMNSGLSYTAPSNSTNYGEYVVGEGVEDFDWSVYGAGEYFVNTWLQTPEYQPANSAYMFPPNWCANDFLGNKVVVGLNNLHTFQPAENGNPQELRIRIYGAAVPIVDEECCNAFFEINCE